MLNTNQANAMAANSKAMKVSDVSEKKRAENPPPIRPTEVKTYPDLPPFNLSATTPTEAWKLFSIVTKEEWDPVESQAREIMAELYNTTESTPEQPASAESMHKAFLAQCTEKKRYIRTFIRF